MKRFITLILLMLVLVPMAEAKRRETPEEIERKTRHNEGWEFGITGRFNLIFYELDRTRILNQKPMRVYQSQARLGGNAMLNAGYHINNHWKVGLEAGAQIQYNYTVVPVCVTAQYFYGKRKNCLFNFVNLGTNMLFDNGVRFGTTAAGGVGYRLQSPDSRLKYDITLGYQALMMTPRPVIEGSYSFKASDVKRQELNQTVFVGLSVSF